MAKVCRGSRSEQVQFIAWSAPLSQRQVNRTFFSLPPQTTYDGVIGLYNMVPSSINLGAWTIILGVAVGGVLPRCPWVLMATACESVTLQRHQYLWAQQTISFTKCSTVYRRMNEWCDCWDQQINMYNMHGPRQMTSYRSCNVRYWATIIKLINNIRPSALNTTVLRTLSDYNTCKTC